MKQHAQAIALYPDYGGMDRHCSIVDGDILIALQSNVHVKSGPDFRQIEQMFSRLCIVLCDSHRQEQLQSPLMARLLADLLNNEKMTMVAQHPRGLGGFDCEMVDTGAGGEARMSICVLRSRYFLRP